MRRLPKLIVVGRAGVLLGCALSCSTSDPGASSAPIPSLPWPGDGSSGVDDAPARDGAAADDGTADEMPSSDVAPQDTPREGAVDEGPPDPEGLDQADPDDSMPSGSGADPEPPPEEPPLVEPHWVGAWASGQQLTETNNNPPAPGLANNTLRQNMFPTLSGQRIRVRFSNEFGNSPVTIGAATIATNAGGSRVEAGSVTPLAFSGNAGATIQPGEALVSDPADFALEALEVATVTTAFGDVPGNVTGHPGSRTTSFIANGGAAVDAATFPAAGQTDHWYFVSNIDVERNDAAAAAVVLGDSITDGRGSVTNGNTRWPDFLAQRLQREPDHQAVSVLNLGIGGNAVLQGGLGPTARARFDSQVLAQPGVRWVVLLEGVNDLGGIGGRSGQQMADAMIGAYQEFIDKSHSAGLAIYGATILPFAGSGYGQNPSALEARRLINDWVLGSGRFDATIDFTPAVATGGDPEQLRQDFLFENDFLHLNPAGLEAMGNAVDLSLFDLEGAQ